MDRYKSAWWLAAAAAFFLYYSGVVWLYNAVRAHIFRKRRIFILMYHRVRDDGKDPHMSVPVKRFREQMHYLHRNFQVVSLTRLLDIQGNLPSLVKDTVAITFDDGYKDNYEHAFPVLRELGLTATIFLVSGRVGQSGDMLDWEEIFAMRQAGIDFGSHTRSHPILATLDEESAKQEIAGAKADIERILKTPIEFFAYPKGKRGLHYNDTTKSIVAAAGYKAAVSTDNGVIDEASDPFSLKRLGIRSVPLFVVKTRISGIFESAPVLFFRSLLAMG